MIVVPIHGGSLEPASLVEGTRRARRSAARRPDRRREVRFDVPVTGAAHAGGTARGDRGPQPGPRKGGAEARRLGGCGDRHGALLRRQRADDRRAGPRHRDRRDRIAGGRHRPRARMLRTPQAHRDGQRRGRRAGRAAAGAAGARGGHRVLAGVRRPAGADLRDGRLGARVRLRGDRRGQGHEVPADVSRVDTGYGVGPLRPDARAGAASAA